VKSRVAGRVHRPALLLALLVTVTGCGSTEQMTTTPPGFTVRAVAEPAFSIALPKSWRSFDSSSKASTTDIAVLNQRLRAELQVLGRPDSPIKLVGVAPTARGTFLTNMNVLQTRVPKSLGFDDLSRNEATQIRLATHAKNLRQTEAPLPAGRALRLTYRARTGAAVHQYFVRHGVFLYILTYTTSPATAARYAKIFDLSAHTFQIR
jgi:hypothetical protein